MNGTIDLDADDIRAILVMTNTTAGADPDIATVATITTLDESDAGGVSRITCTGETVTQVDASDLSKFTTDALSFTGLGGATRNFAGVLFYKFITNDADGIPLAYVEFSFAAASGATQVDVAVPTNGWFYIT